jgi:hypothetical protein
MEFNPNNNVNSSTKPSLSSLGLKQEWRGIIEGEWAGRITGLGSRRVTGDNPLLGVLSLLLQ